MFVGWKRSDTGKIWGLLLQTAFRRKASDQKNTILVFPVTFDDIFPEEFLAGFGIPIFFMDNDIHSKIWNKDHNDTVSMISWPAQTTYFSHDFGQSFLQWQKNSDNLSSNDPMGFLWGFPVIPGTSQTLSCLPSGSIPGGLGQPLETETDGNCGNS